MNGHLLRPFTKEEVEWVIEGFHPIKGPGPDEFLVIFYQKY